MADTPTLAADGLVLRYGPFLALDGVSLRIEPGEIVGIVGQNGAGKSSLLRCFAGLVHPDAGTVRFRGEGLDRQTPHWRTRAGLSLVPEGRGLFVRMSVEECLRMGAYTLGTRARARSNMTRCYDLFPILAERRGNPGTALSGGQQQMVAIGRALMSNPRLILCDEISLGLAPVVIRDIYAALPVIRAEGTSIVVVEQDVGKALSVADHVVCFQEGRMTLEGAPATLTRDAIHHAYFGG